MPQVKQKEVIELNNMVSLLETLQKMKCFQGDDGANYVINVNSKEFEQQIQSLLEPPFDISPDNPANQSNNLRLSEQNKPRQRPKVELNLKQKFDQECYKAFSLDDLLDGMEAQDQQEEDKLDFGNVSRQSAQAALKQKRELPNKHQKNNQSVDFDSKNLYAGQGSDNVLNENLFSFHDLKLTVSKSSHNFRQIDQRQFAQDFVKKQFSKANMNQAQFLKMMKEESNKVVGTVHKNQVDVIFLHASPNLFVFSQSQDQKAKQKYSQLPALNFIKEKRTIKEALQSSGKSISFLSRLATRDNFESIIRKSPKILHISCHGVHLINQKQQMSLNTDLEHCLLFETDQGDGELVNAQQIRKFMKGAKQEIDLVFVAACDSQDIGKVFQRNGAKHVICVEADRQVLDDAVIDFTKTLYSLIFKGEEKICEAFEQAKSAVSFKISDNESNLFILLLQEDCTGRKGKPHHICDPFDDFEDGTVQNLSAHNLVKFIPAKIDSFKFREKDMQKLLENLLKEKARIVQVIALPGYGKSTLVRNTLHYVADRKYFTRGLLLIELKDVKKSFVMLKLMMRVVIRFLDLSEEQKQELQTYSHEAMIEYLTNFFRGEQQQSLKNEYMLSDQQKRQKEQLFLLCLDNASELIEHDKLVFLDFLAIVYDQCPRLRIIVTANLTFDMLPNKQRPKSQFLFKLNKQNSVQLFLDNCGQLSCEEILDLIIQDKNYNYQQWTKRECDYQVSEVSDELKSLMHQKLQNTQLWSNMLESHDMFNHLLGNPTSITMIAQLHQNPLLNVNNTLAEMYKNILNEKTSAFVGYIEMNVCEQNLISLSVAAEMSVKLIESTYPDDINLLYLLGNMPEGVLRADLQEFWCNEVDQSLERLNKLSFFAVGEDKDDSDRLMLTPTMINHVQHYIDKSSKKKIMHDICNFYLKLIKDSYTQIGKTAYSNLQVTTQFKIQQQRYSLQQDLGTESIVQIKRIARELRNIENCISFWVNVAQDNQENDNFTRIASNIGYQHTYNKSKSLTLDEQLQTDSFVNLGREILLNQEPPQDIDMMVSQSQEEYKGRQRTFRRCSSSISSSNRLNKVLNEIEIESASHSSNSQAGPNLNSRIKVQQSVRTKTRNYSRRSKIFGIDADIQKRITFIGMSQKKVELKQIEEADEISSQTSSLYTESDTSKKQSNLSIVQSAEDQSDYNSAKDDSDYNPQKSQNSRSSSHAELKVNQSSDKNQEEDKNNSDLTGTIDFTKLNIRGEIAVSESSSSSSNSDFETSSSEDSLCNQNEEIQSQLAIKVKKRHTTGNSKSNISVSNLSSQDSFADNNNFLEDMFGTNNQNIQRPRINSEKNTGKKQTAALQEAKKKDNRRATVFVHHDKKKMSKEEKFQSLQQIRSQLMVHNLRRVSFYNQRKRSLDIKNKAQMQILLKNSSSTIDISTQEQIWRPMTTEGEFILYFVADTYLKNDFEHSLRISTQDFSYVAYSPLFEGNILRFRALASLKLFEQYNKDKYESPEETLDYLIKSIASLENAYNIFEVTEESNTKDKNYYGMALSSFSLGYIYQQFASELIKEEELKGLCNMSEHEDCFVESEKASHNKASRYYKSAYLQFKQVNHMVGMYLSLLHKFDLESSNKMQSSLNENKMIKWQQMQNWYLKHSEKGSFENSCHILREQGPDISLMTEIVQRLETNLFPSFKNYSDLGDTTANSAASVNQQQSADVTMESYTEVNK